MKRLPGFQDVNSDQQNGGLDEMLTYDRVDRRQARPDRAVAGLGAVQRLRPVRGVGHLHAAESVLRGAGSGAAVLAEPGRPAGHLPAIGRRRSIPLLAVATPQATTTALAVNHTGLFPSVTASFNLAPGVSLSDATLRIQQMQQRLGTPSSIQGFFAGTLLAYQQSLSTEPILVLTALLSRVHRARACFTKAWCIR